MSEIAILQAFEGMPDCRRGQGKRHPVSLCLALFTLAVAAGNQGFEAIGDWLKFHMRELSQLFEVDSVPSYSTIRRVLLFVDYIDYADRLSKFFGVNPEAGETVSLDGKTLRRSYMVQENNPTSEPHPAIILVTAYVVEKGLILPPKQVEFGSNEITALPELIKDLALKGVVFAFDSMNTQKKTIETIVKTGNHYIAAVKGNQPTLFDGIQAEFLPTETFSQINKGHGRTEKRTVQVGELPPFLSVDWTNALTIIRVQRERKLRNKIEREICYFISDLQESAAEFARRIRGYWGVENCVHYVRDVTFGEDRSRTRIGFLPSLWAITRNLAINLYREVGFTNMAKAQRHCGHSLKHILELFRMK